MESKKKRDRDEELTRELPVRTALKLSNQELSTVIRCLLLYSRSSKLLLRALDVVEITLDGVASSSEGFKKNISTMVRNQRSAMIARMRKMVYLTVCSFIFVHGLFLEVPTLPSSDEVVNIANFFSAHVMRVPEGCPELAQLPMFSNDQIQNILLLPHDINEGIVLSSLTPNFKFAFSAANVMLPKAEPGKKLQQDYTQIWDKLEYYTVYDPEVAPCFKTHKVLRHFFSQKDLIDYGDALKLSKEIRQDAE